jgi:oligopeptide transport system substrate-binding protein
MEDSGVARNMNRRHPLRALAAATAVLVLVAACSSTSTTAPTAAPAASAPAATAASSAAPSAGGGTLSIAFQGDIRTNDPAETGDQISATSINLLFDRLVDFDAKLNIIPYLADGMPTISADGTQFTFKLHKGVSFVKPDGTILRELTADDVVYSLNRLLDPNLKPTPSPVSTAFFGGIVGATDVIGGKAATASGLKVIDPYTVEIDLVRPDLGFLGVLATPNASIVPKEVAGQDTSAFSAGPVGSGPFLLKSWTKGQQAVYVRNPHYWMPGVPSLDEIDLRVGVDPNAALQQVQAGTLDLLGDFLPDSAITSVVNDPQYQAQIVHQTFAQTEYIWMDARAPAGTPAAPLANKQVRKAIQYAINKDAIAKASHGLYVVAKCIFPPSYAVFDPTCDPYSYDPAKAKQMLADAGYPNGLPDKIKLYVDTRERMTGPAALIQQDLAKIGIQIEIVAQSQDVQLTTAATPHAAPMGFLEWSQDFPDPEDWIDPILSCATAVAGGSNFADYCNPEVDKMAAAARAETDPQKRIEAYRAVQKAIMDDSPWVVVSNYTMYSLISKRVKNYTPMPLYMYDLRYFAVSG